MSRKAIATLAVLVAAAGFAVLYFWPHPAEAGSGGWHGHGWHSGHGMHHGHGGNGMHHHGSRGGLIISRPTTPAIDVSGRLHLGDFRVLHPQPDRSFDRFHRRQFGVPAEAFGVAPFFVTPDGSTFNDTVVEREIIVPTLMQPAPVAEPAEPLDPRGGAHMVSARGSQAAPSEWELGQVLPPDKPHVMLDPATYGLPEPPPGQIYARVGNDVLRIDATSRRIYAVLAR